MKKINAYIEFLIKTQKKHGFYMNPVVVKFNSKLGYSLYSGLNFNFFRRLSNPWFYLLKYQIPCTLIIHVSLNDQCHKEHTCDPLKMWTKYCDEIYVYSLDDILDEGLKFQNRMFISFPQFVYCLRDEVYFS